MKHLFIINPKCSRLKKSPDQMAADIRDFFSNYPQMDYDVHITRWKRDAVGFTRRYVLGADSLVRVYAIGGSGTLFEVMNGVVGLPNVQIANYPLGLNNSFVYAFGKEHVVQRFRSLRNLVFSPVITADVIQSGNNFGINASLIGAEALGYQYGEMFTQISPLSPNFCYQVAGAWEVVKGCVQRYSVELDGKDLDGNYISLTVANSPCYGKGLHGPTDARINDGLLDVYLIKDVPKMLLPQIIFDYHNGRYQKWDLYISHYRGRSLSIKSDKVMTIVFEGEFFYDTSIRYEIIPGAVDFVYPVPSSMEKHHV